MKIEFQEEMMKATFALLAPIKVHNAVRQLAWNWHRHYGVGTIASRLPPHVSLKQPFAVADLEALQAYMAQFARTVTPFEVRLTEIRLVPTLLDGHEIGIIWVDVEETAQLRDLHNRLNRELGARFGAVQAPFDGPSYHFHLTIAMGGALIETYRKLHAELGDNNLNLNYNPTELAMFVYDEPMGPNAAFLDYHHAPLAQ